TTVLHFELQCVIVNVSYRITNNIFFFQAEDGIRDKLVTGVQTCALPIYPSRRERRQGRGLHCAARTAGRDRSSRGAGADRDSVRSEERRVGKESRTRWVAADGFEDRRVSVDLCSCGHAC